MADADAALADTRIAEWVDAELDLDPVGASALGLNDYDDRLGDFSAARFEDQAREDRRWAGHLDALRLDRLPLETRIDVTLVLTRLAGRAVMEDWQAWRRDPSIYLDPCLGGIFTLFLHRLRPEPVLVAAAIARLQQIPAALASARTNLDAGLAPRLLVERGVRTARSGARYLGDLLPAEVADEGLRADLAAASETAATALDDFAALLDGLAERARGDWAIGEARYSGLLRDRELLAYGTAEMHARGLVASAELHDEMTSVAHQIDAGAGGWPAVVASLAERRPQTPDEMRDAYASAAATARAFCVERDLVTIPDGERCEVVPSPVFQRPVLAVASYIDPPPFSSSTTGHFFVPYPPEGSSAAEVAERLAANSHHLIPTTTVHEAYPGHHWQLTWAQRCTRRVRHVVTTPYFIEGWALYAERMMREEGYFAEPAALLGHLTDRLLRAARIVVDTALHSGDMTVEEGVQHMMTATALPEPVARAEVDRYCAWPTQASAYLTGSLEIERIRTRWQDSTPSGSLRGFHDAIAASPGLPLPLAELSLFGG